MPRRPDLRKHPPFERSPARRRAAREGLLAIESHETPVRMRHARRPKPSEISRRRRPQPVRSLVVGDIELVAAFQKERVSPRPESELKAAMKDALMARPSPSMFLVSSLGSRPLKSHQFRFYCLPSVSQSELLLLHSTGPSGHSFHHYKPS